MSKIIVRRQEYANNGTHANEIESVVKDNLIVNTLSSALDVAPSVGLLNSVKSGLDGDVSDISNLLLFNKANMFYDYWRSNGTNINTVNVRVPYVGYRCTSGLIFTRYGIIAFGTSYGNGEATHASQAKVLLGDESITQTYSNYTFSFKSHREWNYFSVIGTLNYNEGNKLVSISYSLT